MQNFNPKLRAALPPERRHLVDTEVRHFESLYEDHWPEIYVPTAVSGRKAVRRECAANEMLKILKKSKDHRQC